MEESGILWKETGGGRGGGGGPGVGGGGKKSPFGGGGGGGGKLRTPHHKNSLLRNDIQGLRLRLILWKDLGNGKRI